MYYLLGIWMVALVLPVALEEPVCTPGASCASQGEGRKHHWPQPAGHHGRWATSPLRGPDDLNASLRWSWHHPDGRHGDVTHTALLDDQANVYVTGVRGVFKLAPDDGSLLWWHKTEVNAHGGTSIMGDALYGIMTNGNVYAVDLEKGERLWTGGCATHTGCEQDTTYVQAYEGVVLTACDKQILPGSITWPGNSRICSLNATTGETLWEYQSEKVFWNFYPMFPGDDTFVAQDCHGGLYRIGVFDGKKRWYVPGVDGSFTDGGAILGPGGTTAYTCSALGHSQVEDSGGVMRKYQVSDGKLLWEKRFQQACTSWPAVTADDSLVVVPVGSLPSPHPAEFSQLKWLPIWFRILVHKFSIWLGDKQQWLWWNPDRKTSIHAFDAKTGEERWKFEDIPPWKQVASKGDEDLWLGSNKTIPWRIICGPAAWGSPAISGDGTVYVGHMNGLLYAVRDADGDGRIDSKTEVSTFDMKAASLHPGMAFAPGFMVYSSCRGTFAFNLPQA